jgi:hypothetical protein
MSSAAIAVAISVSGAFVAALCALLGLRDGLRRGDLPGDAVTTVRAVKVATREGEWRVLRATVRNESPFPVIAAVSVRPARLWFMALRSSVRVRVPRRTVDPRFAPSLQDEIAAVEAGGECSFTIPIGENAPHRAARVVVAVGQAGSRLRVIEHLVPLLSPQG